ncbi:MAG TPA: oxygenase MpaB family protein [Pseudonocardia sp.]|jgi:uncharacterized protein (DUF2236 family)
MTPSSSGAGSASARTHTAQPFGPDSLIWHYLGDLRNALGGRAATTLQVMHPAIGAAVSDPDLSVFFTEPIARLRRSGPLIMGVVYNGPGAHHSADTLRDMHLQIKGTITGGAKDGQHFHALDPEVFYWAHATFVYTLFATIEAFHHPLTTARRDQLYTECRQWYRLYGLSERPMPPDYPSFVAYLERMCDTELEATATAVRGKAMFGDPKTIPQQEMPVWLWRLLTPLPIRLHTFLCRGLMPPIIREKMNYSWTPTDERRFRAAAWVIRAVVPRLPARIRYSPVALAAFERDGWPTQ